MDLNAFFKKANKEFSLDVRNESSNTNNIEEISENATNEPVSEPEKESVNTTSIPEENGTNKTEISNNVSVLEDVAFNRAMELYFADYHNANMISTKICDGEVVDEAQVSVIFRSLADTYKSYVSKRNYLEPGGKPVPLIRYGIPTSDIALVMEGNKLVGEAMSNNDLSKYEHGKWLLYCCQQ